MVRCSVVSRVLVPVALGSLTIPAGAQVPGGGPARTACYVQWSGITPNQGRNLACQDGDPSCDVDGVQNGVCVLGVAVSVAQTNVPECVPPTIEKVTTRAQPRTIKVGSLHVAVTPPILTILPISSPTCSHQSTIRPPPRRKKNRRLMPAPRATLPAMAGATRKPRKPKNAIRG